MKKKCPIDNSIIKESLEKGEYFEILMGKGKYWLEAEKYCERGAYRLWHARLAVVDEILDWAIWKEDIKCVMAKFSEALERIVEEDPMVALDALHSYVSCTIKDKFKYGPQEEEMDIDFGLDCWHFYDLAKSKEACLNQYHYNEDEWRVDHRLLEVLPQYFPSRI